MGTIVDRLVAKVDDRVQWALGPLVRYIQPPIAQLNSTPRCAYWR
jgi:hypothetical protein